MPRSFVGKAGNEEAFFASHLGVEDSCIMDLARSAFRAGAPAEIGFFAKRLYLYEGVVPVIKIRLSDMAGFGELLHTSGGHPHWHIA